MNHLAHTEPESRETFLSVSTTPKRQTLPALLHPHQDNCPTCRAIRAIASGNLTSEQHADKQTVILLSLGLAGVAA